MRRYLAGNAKARGYLLPPLALPKCSAALAERTAEFLWQRSHNTSPEGSWRIRNGTSAPHRVGVWRQLRKTGAVAVSPGVWALPTGPAFQSDLDRASDLCRKGGGILAVIDASPRDQASAAILQDAFATVRVDEWTGKQVYQAVHSGSADGVSGLPGKAPPEAPHRQVLE